MMPTFMSRINHNCECTLQESHRILSLTLFKEQHEDSLEVENAFLTALSPYVPTARSLYVSSEELEPSSYLFVDSAPQFPDYIDEIVNETASNRRIQEIVQEIVNETASNRSIQCFDVAASRIQDSNTYESLISYLEALEPIISFLP